MLIKLNINLHEQVRKKAEIIDAKTVDVLTPPSYVLVTRPCEVSPCHVLWKCGRRKKRNGNLKALPGLGRAQAKCLTVALEPQ